MRFRPRAAARLIHRLLRTAFRRVARRQGNTALFPDLRGGYVGSALAPVHGATRDPAGLRDTTIVITSASAELLAISRSLLDEEWPIYVIDGSQGRYGLAAIRHAIENVSARRAVLLDEDAFVLDNERLRDLVASSAQRGLDAVGVPDGGVVGMRVHNPNALNPFFNILDLASIRRVWDAEQCLSWMGRGSEMTAPWPPASLLKPEVPYVFDDYEPYYCFYFWLNHVGLTTGYLNAYTHSDGVSTVVLDHEQRPLVVHSWYARKFDDGPMRDRILDVVAFARGEGDRCERWRGRDWSRS